MKKPSPDPTDLMVQTESQCPLPVDAAGSNVVELSSRRKGGLTPIELVDFGTAAELADHVEAVGADARAWLETHDAGRLRDEERARADVARASPVVRAAALAFVKAARAEGLSFGGMNAIVGAAFLDVDGADALASE